MLIERAHTLCISPHHAATSPTLQAIIRFKRKIDLADFNAPLLIGTSHTDMVISESYLFSPTIAASESTAMPVIQGNTEITF